MTRPEAPGPSRSLVRRYRADESGASALEFAIVAGPFILLLLCVMQVGLYYTTQSSLNAGVTRAAESLRSSFAAAGTPTLPSATALKTMVASRSGGLVRNDSSLAVEIRPLALLAAVAVPVTDGTNDYGTVDSPLVIRAQANAMTFLPGLSVLTKVRASAIVRRQGK